jgi:hypothetical protein
MIFVFGSNLAGIHGAGSAQHARLHYGAVYGLGVGPQGKSYAIPTKDSNLNVLDLEVIQLYVRQFLSYAKQNHQETFNVVSIGCGLAGFRPEQIAPMFRGHPMNVILTDEFNQVLVKG